MPIIEPDTQLYDDSESIGSEQEIVEKDSILSATIGIQWQGKDCQFTDWNFLANINLWRDYLPPEIEMKLPGQITGNEIKHQYKAGELLEDKSSSNLHSVSKKQFQPSKKGFNPILPSVGRFYPKDFLYQISGVYEGNKFPCRITSIQDQTISVDLNHPLAGKDFEMIMRIESIKKSRSERGGRCNDITSLCSDHGQGMQDMLEDTETNFFDDDAFSRLDPNNDAMFFKQADFTPFWDSVALQQVTQLYNSLIPKQAQVLDLMAGAHSPLQDAIIEVESVTCAGLNDEEMAFNTSCNVNFNIDVNSMTSLPFQNDQFDTVLIHAAIEYVINPNLLFAEINRVLKPSGRVIISFSNRSIPEKTIQLWTGAHEFERPAIILSYLRFCGGFGHFNSYSKRGLLRPDDDKQADKLLYSDPVYVVWAEKTSSN